MLRQELLDEIKKLSMDEQLELLEFVSQQIRYKHRLEAMKRLEGVLGMESDAPTDAEVKEDYISYLQEKYK